MKFLVTRTSEWDDRDCPDPRCYSETVHILNSEWFHVEELREKVRQDILSRGSVIHEEKEKFFVFLKSEIRWFIDFNSLEELVQFRHEYDYKDDELVLNLEGQDDILDYPDIVCLEIYDGYRE